MPVLAVVTWAIQLRHGSAKDAGNSDQGGHTSAKCETTGTGLLEARGCQQGTMNALRGVVGYMAVGYARSEGADGNTASTPSVSAVTGLVPNSRVLRSC